MVQEIQNPLNVTLDGEWIEFRQIPERDLMAFIRFVCLFTVFEISLPPDHSHDSAEEVPVRYVQHALHDAVPEPAGGLHAPQGASGA